MVAPEGAEEYLKKYMIRRIIRVLTPQEKRRLGLLMGVDVITSVADIAFLALLLFIVRIYTEGGRPGFLSFLPARFRDPHSLWLIGIFFLLFGVKNLLSFLIYQAQSRFRYDVASRISLRNLVRYLEGIFSEYTHVDSSVHILRIAQQPIEFCQFVLAGLQQAVSEGTLILVTVIAVLLFNAKLFLLVLVLLLPPVVITAWLTKRRLHAARTFIKKSRDIMWQHLQESIAAYVESNLYGKKEFFSKRYGYAQSILNRHLSTLQAMQGAPSRLAEIFAVFGLLALIGVGEFTGHSTEFVTLGAFLAAAYKIIPGIARLLNIAGQMKTYEFTVNNVLNDPSGATGAATMKPAGGPIRALECRHIGFHYKEVSVLNDLGFRIGAGDFLGIQGGSGKGKTTLLNIILGFVEPEKGEVVFNDMPGGGKEGQRYWRHIAYVRQHPFIIHDTLRVNITLDEEKHDPDRLQQAIQWSGLDEVMKKWPDGIDTLISENGKNISGGQRQRIAIARAFYKNADLYLLDEPCSELDDASEEQLLHQFRRLAAEGKMVVMITHNKESLAWCNRTLSLDGRQATGSML
jgi:ABC-type bacteriocin/lantibiotic exporter with double-glycine peptidase domain